jgi:hypothetical protein
VRDRGRAGGWIPRHRRVAPHVAEYLFGSRKEGEDYHRIPIGNGIEIVVDRVGYV